MPHRPGRTNFGRHDEGWAGTLGLILPVLAGAVHVITIQSAAGSNETRCHTRRYNGVQTPPSRQDYSTVTDLAKFLG